MLRMRGGSDSQSSLSCENDESLPPVDYYAVLNVEHDATEDDIKSSYKRLCVTYHPDKHTSEDKKFQAEKRFLLISKAFDVLGDPVKRHIYDLYGEKEVEEMGTSMWEVGQRLKSKDEIREEFERRSRLRREMDAENLVKSTGKIEVGLDITPIIKRKRYIPKVLQAFVQHSWETKLNNQTNLILNGHVIALNGIGNANITSSFIHMLNSTTWSQFSLSIGESHSVMTKLHKNFTEDMWANATISANRLDIPPVLTLFAGRKVSETSNLYMSYVPGIMSIGGWGREDATSNASCTLGFFSKQDKNKYDAEIIAGLQQSGLILSHSRPVSTYFRGRIEISATNTSGLSSSLMGDHEIDKNTKLGFGVEIAEHGVRLRFEYNSSDKN